MQTREYFHTWDLTSCYRFIALFSWFILMPVWGVAQTINTTDIPNQLFKPSGGNNYTYCVTIFGDGNGDDWSLGTGFYMRQLTSDGPDTDGDGVREGMVITAEDANSCTIEYTPTADGPGGGTLEIIYTDTGTGLNDVLNVPITINAAAAPTAPSVRSNNLGTAVAPNGTVNLSFDLNGGNTEYTASVASTTGSWTPSITPSELNRRSFTISGNAPAVSGPFSVDIDFAPCDPAVAATTITFSGNVQAPATDVEINITGSDGNPSTPAVFDLPPAMVGRDYPSVSLPTFSASGGNGTVGTNSHDWTISSAVSWLSLTPANSVAEDTTVNFSTSAPSATGTVNFNITAEDPSTGASNPDSKAFQVEVLPALTLNTSSTSYKKAVGDGVGDLVATIAVPMGLGLSGSGALSDWQLVASDGTTPLSLSWLTLSGSSLSTEVNLRRTGDPASGGDIVQCQVRFTESNGYSAVSDLIRIEITRRPVDIVFVFDKSGSMDWSAINGNNRTRWFYLKEAVANLMNWFRNEQILNEDDRIGLVYFSSDVVISSPLQNYSANLLNQVQNSLGNFNPGGATGMGAGISTALHMLCGGSDEDCGNSDGTSDNRSKIAIVVTDGDQNRKPGLYTTRNRTEINSTEEEFESWRDATFPLPEIGDWYGEKAPINFRTAEFGNGNYKIFTIALTENVSSNTLENLTRVSEDTRASHDATYNNLDDNEGFVGYSEDFSNAMVKSLQGGSPQILDIRKRRLPAGGIGEENFKINDHVASTSFWLKASPEVMQRLKMRVFKGTQELLPIEPFVDVSNGDSYSIFTVSFVDSDGQETVNPQGDWTIRVQGQENDYFEVFVDVDEHYLDYQCYLEDPVILAGDNLNFVANVDYLGAPVPDLKVTARILGPGEDFATLVANAPTPAAMRPWLQSDYTWNVELYNKLDVDFGNIDLTGRQFTISGQALNANGQPVPGAMISLRGKNVTTTSDKEGRYTLSGVEAGDVAVVRQGDVLKEIVILGGVLAFGNLVFDFFVDRLPDQVDETLAEIIRTEPGITPAEAKVEYLRRQGLFNNKIQQSPNEYRLLYRGGGRYSIPYPGNEIPGSQRVVYRLEGDIPGVGEIRRLTFNSALVKFGLLDLEASEFVFIEERIVDGVVFGYFEIKPVDQFGHSIGLNMGFNIDIAATNNPTFELGPFVDRLDGSYVFPASYSAGSGVPQVVVTVDDQATPLFEGSIDDITEEEKEPFRLPIAFGVALPTGNFSDAFDPGWIAELKFGVPLNKKGKLNLNLEGGFYSFDQQPQSDAFQVLGGAAGLRYDLFQVLGGDVFFDVNPLGYYKPTEADGAYGLNGGAGIFWNVLIKQLSVGLEGSYYYITTDDPITFLGLGAGIRVNLVK